MDHPPHKNRHSSPPPSPAQPAAGFLADLYRHLPLLVVHLTLDGTLLHANPEVQRVTGYAESDLLGKNFWAILFPGRLFAQVPKFTSAIQPLQAFATDVPMTLRTHDGHYRVIAWSRFIHDGVSSADCSTGPSLVCIGNDLTDRLTDADRGSSASEELTDVPHLEAALGNAGVIEGDIVTPLAVSPPLPPLGENYGAAVEKVQNFAAAMDERLNAICTAFDAVEAGSLSTPEHLAATALLHAARRSALQAHLEEVHTLIQQTSTLCRPPGDFSPDE